MSFSDPAASFLSASPFSRDSVSSPKISRRHGNLYLRVLPVLLLPVLFTGCGHKQSGAPAHYAFIGFENLSGDASLDWVSVGAGEYLSRSLRGAMASPTDDSAPGDVLSPDAVNRANQTLGARADNAPAISVARTGAQIAGANEVIAGYVARTPSAIRITASEENTATHKIVRTVSATAPSPFEALNLLAHEFSAQAGPPPTGNAEAFRLFSTALQGTPAAAAPLLERAVALDPGFGRAWVTLARVFTAEGDRPHAADVIERGRAQKIAPLDHAWLDFESAALSGDRSASLAAMRKVTDLDPADTGLARNLAAAETAEGNFSQAAAVWKRLTANAPGDVNAWNQLGYTLGWSGDYAGALGALREYARLRPGDANPLDSEGDVHYWFGKFADAAASYSAAYAKAPGFLNGGESYKAAWAKFLAGDKAGADASFAKFREAREKAKDPQIDLFAGDWLYRTGRGKEARALLTGSQRKATAEPPALLAGTAAQLALWDLLAGDRAAAARDLAGGGTSANTPGSLIVRFVAMPTASAAEWEARAAHLLAAPQLAALRTTALGYALILDGRKQAAIPVWEEIVRQSNGSDAFPRNILARLKGQRVEHPSPPDPVNLNEFNAVLDRM